MTPSLLTACGGSDDATAAGVSAADTGDAASAGDGMQMTFARWGEPTRSKRTQAESPIVDRWNEYMADILELVMDPETGAQPKLEPVFRLD